MSSSLNTEELVERLQRHVLGPGSPQGSRAFLFREVGLGGRRADAISTGLWASRGFAIQGYELKTNRRDWLSEYEDHGKAEPAMAVCDRFWLVTNPGVIEEHELPEKWGLLLSNGKRRKLVVAKKAPLLREGEPPINRDVLAQLLRGIFDLTWEKEKAIRDQERQSKYTASEMDFEGLQNQLKRAEDANQEEVEAFEAFKRAAGIPFLSWKPRAAELKLVGEAVAVLSGDQQEFFIDNVKREEGRLEEALQHLRSSRKAIEQQEAV